MKDMNELVKAYLTIRNERERIESEYKDRDTRLKADMAVLEQEMLAGCNDMNVESLRTDSGTVVKSLRERYTCADRDNFNKFVLETGAVELFEARLHQGNFKEFMSERHHEGLPPGVNVMREFTITVRKPTSRVS
jgi:predicted DNA binding protein